MGTTDKDELVKQLQKLLGQNVNYLTAAFFLDMNNWNLQAAVCSYLDVGIPVPPLPSMSLVSDPVASDLENVEPNIMFEKSWHICNSGTDAWPAGCYAQCADGNNMGAGKVPLPCLLPGHSMNLVVNMISPSEPGTYQSKWRLCISEGSYFGDPMWVIVTVVDANAVALVQQLSGFELGAPVYSAENPHNPFVINQMAKPNDNNGKNSDMR